MSPTGRHRWGRDAVVVVGAVVPHPSLWWSALATLARLARRGWWHRAPFLPVPGEAYWQFRLETAFGGEGGSGGTISSDNVVAYLQWCRRTRPHRG
jgi:hypothetical protein